MNVIKKETNVLKRKIFRILKIIGFTFLAIISFCFLALGILRFIYSPILRASNKISAPGIDLMETVDIGGIKQLLYFRGKNIENPVILFLHGGPGSTIMPLLHTFQYEWEKEYTVIHWDQRNSGKTFYLNNPDSVLQTMNFNRVLEDGHEVTQYIKNKLGKEKIIILGHSWGSVLGTALVQTYTDDYVAYIGVGQTVNLIENERVGYQAVLEAARKAGNEKDVSTLESFASYWPPKTYNEKFRELIVIIRGYQTKYNLAAGPGPGVIISVLSTPYYNLKDAASSFTIDTLHYQEPIFHFLIDEYDIHNFGTEYKIPVFYIMGENDYQTPYPLAKDFFQEIKASTKTFFSVPDAGHLTMVDNKKEFTRVLLEEIRPIIQE